MNATLTTCAHCHERHPSVRLYRLAGVGLRGLCAACFASLSSIGMDIHANPVMRVHDSRSAVGPLTADPDSGAPALPGVPVVPVRRPVPTGA